MVYPFSPFSTVGCVLQGGHQLQREGVQALSALPPAWCYRVGTPPRVRAASAPVLCHCDSATGWVLQGGSEKVPNASSVKFRKTAIDSAFTSVGCYRVGCPSGEGSQRPSALPLWVCYRVGATGWAVPSRPSCQRPSVHHTCSPRMAPECTRMQVR